MNKKDNPVPSIDSKDIKFIIFELKHKRLFDICPSYKKRYIDKLISKLENGVETNKEQPNTQVCDCANERKLCNNKCNY